MKVAKHAIDILEAAYDLDVEAADWMPNVVRAGGAAFDRGLDGIAMQLAGTRENGETILSQIFTASGSGETVMKMTRAMHEIDWELLHSLYEANRCVAPLSEIAKMHPEVYEPFTRHLGCKDIFTINAYDPDGHGVAINVPTPNKVELTPAARQQWSRTAVHVATAHRLRRRISLEQNSREDEPEVPFNAEALVDPSSFLVAHAVGQAKSGEAAVKIRQAARHVDRARGKLRRDDPDEALRLWQAMVQGRWSIVDWFDSDGRRFVLAKPNAPNLGDPRGLTKREHQVVTYASYGESLKLIAYRLGISEGRVSKLLGDGMHKLGVKSQAQLVEKMRGMPPVTAAEDQFN